MRENYRLFTSIQDAILLILPIHQRQHVLRDFLSTAVINGCNTLPSQEMSQENYIKNKQLNQISSAFKKAVLQ